MITELFQALSKTRKGIAGAFNTLIKQRVTSETLEMLEDTLMTADLGIYTTSGIIKVVEKNATKNFIKAVRKHMLSILPEEIHELPDNPCVVLVVGVNGAGKTTTAAKLAHYYKSMGKNVILVGADTYRAAALEQLKIWSNRIGVRLVSSQSAKDPSAVIYDGIKAAQNDDSNIVVVDTAGRLHTHKNLMTELEKMKRTIVEKFKDYSVKTMITIDANLGQNSLFFELFFLLLLFLFPDDFFLADFLLVDRWAYSSDVCTGNILVNNNNITSRTTHLVCVWRM